MRALIVVGLLALAACGADGAPERPEPRERLSGPGVQLSVTGSAEVGVASR